MRVPAECLQVLSRSKLWAILPNALTVIANSILKGQSWPSNWQSSKPSTEWKDQNKIVIIPIQGVLSKDGPSWMGSNYDGIADAAEKAAADVTVKQVVLSVDSPGGEVTGLPETAAVLSQVAKVKPVTAMVEGTAASAAYWLASQARDIVLTPSGEVGSVGVRMMHVNVSKMLEDAGYKVTELYSGNFKTEWSPFKPLSEEAVADMQPRLDAAHNEFLTGIANGRGSRVSAEMKEQRMGEGRMFRADVAASHGLVDRVQSAHEFYKSIVSVPEYSSASVRNKFGFQRARIDLEKGRL